jgi:tRNA1Val (adenine37-N6)-methyltransferase
MSKQRIFRFKQFSIDHSRATMKVGTDGVLLGAWANVKDAKQLLDIGTGSGVIALMLAQRSDPDARIDAVELEAVDAHQAEENVAQSPWPTKVTIHQCAIQDFHPQKQYDCIVTNPPYFINSYRAPDARRTEVRHTTSLSYETLVESISRLLAPEGRFSVILPPVESERFFAICSDEYYLTRKCLFRSRREKPIERILFEFARVDTALESAEIILYGQGEEWSEEYKALTREFYLKA